MSATALNEDERLVGFATVVVPGLVGSQLTAQLSPRERQALYYSAVLGLSGRQIAALLGVSAGAARMYVARARARVLIPPAPGRRVWCQGQPDTERGA